MHKFLALMLSAIPQLLLCDGALTHVVRLLLVNANLALVQVGDEHPAR